MSPTISVIVPVYNVQDYVATSINSIVAAGSAFCDKYVGKTFEIIVVDDGSADGSGAIIDQCAIAVNRSDSPVGIQVFHQTNAGVAKARQVGLDNAAGEYIAWVDPDDWVEKEYYVRLYETAIASNADLVACDMIRDEGEKTFRIIQSFDENADAYLRANVSGDVLGSLCNKLFKHSSIREHGIAFPVSDCETMEDLYFICALLLHNPKVTYLPEAFYHYVFRKGSLVTQPFTDRFVMRWARSNRLIEELLAHKGLEELFYFKKAKLKFGIYSFPSITDKVFYGFCPEVKSLWGYPFPLHHKVLFGLVVRLHCRRVVMLALSFIRCFRKGRMK